MSQKVLKVGTSAAVTIPKKAMEKLGVRIGDNVNVDVDESARTLLIRPEKGHSAKDMRVAKLTASFIERYRKDLEALAKK